MLYGLGGLASIVSTALEACGPGGVSFTLEVHQAEGRLPLGDAAPLFPPGSDTATAERVNYWLSVLSENVMLLSQAIAAGAPNRQLFPGRRGHQTRRGRSYLEDVGGQGVGVTTAAARRADHPGRVMLTRLGGEHTWPARTLGRLSHEWSEREQAVQKHR